MMHPKAAQWLMLTLLIIAIISLLSWLLPDQPANLPLITKQTTSLTPESKSTQSVANIKNQSDATSNSNLPVGIKQKIATNSTINSSTKNRTAIIKNITIIEAMRGSVVLLANEFNFNAADDKSKFAYLAALAQCAQFIKYAQQDYLNITVETDKATANVKISPTKKKQAQNCQGAPVNLITPIYSRLEKLALNTQNTEVSIQSDLLLSHLPNLKPSKNAEKSSNDGLEHYKKQLMWLEHARQQGSLEALLKLAIRYQYGEVPDPLTASSYYLTLQTIAPEYQLTDQVEELTQNLKTWQLTQAKQNSQLYLKQMEQLNTLYKW